MIKSKRTLIIGDVHGCYEELGLLLKEVKAKPGDDDILFIGDLINKGPSGYRTWKLCRKVGGVAIRGNHEMSLLSVLKGDAHRHKKYLGDLRKDFGKKLEAFAEDVRRWPLWIERDNFLMVHAGLEPGKRPEATNPWTLVTIRTWDGEGKDLNNEIHPPWFDYYDGNKLVVFGHWAALGGVERPNVIGLDSGCVYGGSLSCLILPERKIVRVKARRAYASIRL